MQQSALNRKIKAIVFDLGGVLIELDGPPLLREWIKEDITLEENKRRWGRCPSVEAFEKGQLSVPEFVRGVIRDLQLDVEEAAFLERFVRWPAGLYPGVLGLLEALRREYVLGFFSNTSELHWPRIMHEMQLADKFDYCFASFQIARYKPDVASFRYVAQKMKMQAHDILFLDDSAANVDAAQEAGMQGLQVLGLEEVKTALKALGCLQ